MIHAKTSPACERAPRVPAARAVAAWLAAPAHLVSVAATAVGARSTVTSLVWFRPAGAMVGRCQVGP